MTSSPSEPTLHVRCTHTRGARTQQCILLHLAGRTACLPIAPSEHGLGVLATGLASTVVGVAVRLRTRTVQVSARATAEDLDAAVAECGGFVLGPDWTYRTHVPILGTMLLAPDQNITTREPVPPAILAGLTPQRGPTSFKAVKVACAIGIGILALGGVVALVTGSLEALFGIGFFGVLVIGAALFAFVQVRRHG